MCKVIEDEIEKGLEKQHELEREIQKLRDKIKQLVKRQHKKKMRSNLTKEEQQGRKKAYADKERVFISADKEKLWWLWIKLSRKVEKTATSLKWKKS